MQIKVRSHGFYHQEYFRVEINHFWIKSCSGKFSAFTKQEEAASSLSYRSWSASAEDYVMVRLNRRMYSVYIIILSLGITLKMPQESSPRMMKTLCG